MHLASEVSRPGVKISVIWRLQVSLIFFDVVRTRSLLGFQLFVVRTISAKLQTHTPLRTFQVN